MTEQIKKRIAEINQGKVPDGYKNTINGIISNSWEEKKLGELLTFKNGINAEKSKFGSGVKLISVMDILDESPIKYEKIQNSINIDEDTLNIYNVTYGDILFQRSSENFIDAGKSNVYLDESYVATFSGFVIRGKKNYDYDPFYLNSLLKLSSIRKQIINLAAGSQHINIGQESLSKIAIFLPALKEQQKIAEVLMKWEEAIALQEKLIEKLEVQKKALMQRLLIPKDDWHKKKLSEVIKVFNGYAFKSELYEEDGGVYSILTIACVQNNSLVIDKNTPTINELPQDIRVYQILEINDVLMSLTGNVGRICRVDKTNCLLNQRVAKIEVLKPFDKNFVYQILKTYRFVEHMKMYAQGAAQDNLSVKDIYKYKIWIPKDTNAQKYVSKILGTYDSSLEMHRQKLNKLKLQQKSLMQLLLTGIVRV